ncbi:PrgI family protein [Catellatospora chokoriensis]|uniref:PrgI family protein n=1 Tax=Catellatospora chokoriensis TaxID=310353 RepID=A0A8J3K041_9ACTN|nr:PrgI family protein [Catellatospora chokoriensis]GIF90466.1 hypothetical protein Cch02nite_39100 [Catellatospora chokoriensis]
MSEYELGAHIPADVDAPDKVVYNLTFRQAAILAATAAGLWLAWQQLRDLLPGPVLLAVGLPVAAVAVVVALGRRDGLSLDRWLLAGLRHARTPKAYLPPHAAGAGRARLLHTTSRPVVPGVLQLPAQAVGADGVLDLGQHGTAAVVAVSTVNFGLRDPAEQAALIDTFGRWLNALTCPTQILLTTRPVDLTARARTLSAAAGHLNHDGLAALAADHAVFLTRLGEQTQPLARQVLVVVRDPARVRARRHADDTAAALARCAANTRVLDPTQLTHVLTHAVDPRRPGGLP